MKAAMRVLGVVLVLILALAVGSGLRVRQEGVVRSAGSSPFIPPSPSPAPLVTPRPWQAVTAADVLRGIASDPWVADTIKQVPQSGSPVFAGRASAPVTLGTPVFVRAILPGAMSEWLIPLQSAGATVGVIGAKVDQDGRGAASFYTSWGGSFPHAISVSDAIAKGSVPTDPVVRTELVWATVSPLEGGPGTAEYPFYRLVRRSGSEWFLFQNGNLVAADKVHPR